MSWARGFDSQHIVSVSEERSFRVFHAGSAPLDLNPAVFVLVHGAGQSALSWTLVAAMLRSTAHLIAVDMRGHGMTRAYPEHDLSLTTLVADLLAVVHATCNVAWIGEAVRSAQSGGSSPPTQEQKKDTHIDTLSSATTSHPACTATSELDSSSSPSSTSSPSDAELPVVFVGHSLGGSVATHAAQHSSMKTRAKGLVMVDLVEGTALASIPFLRTFLSERPKVFSCLDEAFQWHVAHSIPKSLSSATISVPALLVSEPENGSLTWRTNLEQSEPHWKGWFVGLSNKFLDGSLPKLLILAGTDRLDTDLTRGQMQGKFQLVLKPECGHMIQEDAPEAIAEALLSFFTRYRLDGAPLPALLRM